jgi:peptide/nickel transport system substrate-binding protein
VGREVAVAQLETTPLWGEPAKVDVVELQAIDDATARLNAVKAGEIDFAALVPPSSVAGERKNGDLELIRSKVPNVAFSLIMNNQVAPFDDPAVRRALRLAVDRKALVDAVFFGEGVVGKDLMGYGQPGYLDDAPESPHDPDQARRLFAQAGVTSLTIRAGEVAPGLVSSAELIAEQLRGLGLDAQVDEVPADQYYGEDMFTAPLETWGPDNELPAYWLGLTTGPGAAFPLGGKLSPEYDQLFAQWRRTPDRDRQSALFEQLQERYRDEGGLLTWGFGYAVHAARPGVEGVESSGQTFLLQRASVG